MEPSLDRAMAQGSSGGRIVTAGATPKLLVEANTQRTAFFVSTDFSDYLQIGVNSDDVAQSGMWLAPNTPPVLVSLATHGTMCQRAWYLACPTKTARVYVVESISSAQ